MPSKKKSTKTKNTKSEKNSSKASNKNNIHIHINSHNKGKKSRGGGQKKHAYGSGVMVAPSTTVVMGGGGSGSGGGYPIYMPPPAPITAPMPPPSSPPLPPSSPSVSVPMSPPTPMSPPIPPETPMLPPSFGIASDEYSTPGISILDNSNMSSLTKDSFAGSSILNNSDDYPDNFPGMAEQIYNVHRPRQRAEIIMSSPTASSMDISLHNNDNKPDFPGMGARVRRVQDNFTEMSPIKNTINDNNNNSNNVLRLSATTHSNIEPKKAITLSDANINNVDINKSEVPKKNIELTKETIHHKINETRNPPVLTDVNMNGLMEPSSISQRANNSLQHTFFDDWNMGQRQTNFNDTNMPTTNIMPGNINSLDNDTNHVLSIPESERRKIRHQGLSDITLENINIPGNSNSLTGTTSIPILQSNDANINTADDHTHGIIKKETNTQETQTETSTQAGVPNYGDMTPAEIEARRQDNQGVLLHLRKPKTLKAEVLERLRKLMPDFNDTNATKEQMIKSIFLLTDSLDTYHPPNSSANTNIPESVHRYHRRITELNGRTPDLEYHPDMRTRVKAGGGNSNSSASASAHAVTPQKEAPKRKKDELPLETPPIAKKKADVKSTPENIFAHSPYNDDYDKFEGGEATSKPDWNYDDI